MDRMPEPGDAVPYSFTAMPGRCLRLVYDHNLQAHHCPEPVAWKGIWTDRTGTRHAVEACREHAPKWVREMTG
jgi:hypothetical protein